MAVSLNTPSMANLRSDYAVSDAAMPARNANAAQSGKQQDSQFDKMLSHLSEKTELRSVNEDIDSGKYDVPTLEDLEKAGVIAIDKDTGRVSAPNTEKLAAKLIEGGIDEENIPIELLTPELLKAISALRDNISEKSDDIGEVFPTIEKPAKDVLTEKIAGSDILEELAQLLMAAGGENPDNSALLENIPDEIARQAVEAVGAQDIVLPDNAKSDNTAKTDDSGVFAEIVENHVKAQQNAENQTQENSADAQNFAEQSVPDELKNLGSEKLDVLQKAFKDGEISEVEVKNTVSSEENTQAVPEKTAEEPEFTEQKPRVESAKSAVSEELEMLRNAKAKPVSENREQTEYSLVLNPEELGRITVKMTRAADGAVSVTIAAENSHTQRVLEQHSELMQANLKDSGINLESWQTVHESQQEARAQDYNGSGKNPYFTQQDNTDGGEDDGEESFADIIAAM